MKTLQYQYRIDEFLNNTLPDKFDGGAKVPQRFQKEFNKRKIE